MKKNILHIRINRLLIIVFLTIQMLAAFNVSAQQRFPKPEFETGYVQPSPTTPEPRGFAMEYLDVFILFLVLSLASYFVIKTRSRRSILWLSIFSLIYFGFYRDGCICSVGSLQNITLSLFDPGYTISLAVLIFFMLPLLFALFFGRTFCAAVCPLGVIQDLIVTKPTPVPQWLNKILGFFPYIYLGLAILFAATGTDFIICRYDPFVGIFRLNAPFHMIVLGVSFLLLGLIFARPYCRVLCPYGVLLNWMSKFSKWHMTITPSDCIDCKLCSASCPFDAIDFPNKNIKQDKNQNVRKFIIYAIILPLLVLAGGFSGAKSHLYLSKAHPDVYLAELLIKHPELKNDKENLDIQAFMESGKSFDKLAEDAGIIREKFYLGSTIMGGFLGLVIGLMLLNLLVHRTKIIYEPNKGNCYSCGRCMDYCPVKKN
jgi:polyferredoxin